MIKYNGPVFGIGRIRSILSKKTYDEKIAFLKKFMFQTRNKVFDDAFKYNQKQLERNRDWCRLELIRIDEGSFKNGDYNYTWIDSMLSSISKSTGKMSLKKKKEFLITLLQGIAYGRFDNVYKDNLNELNDIKNCCEIELIMICYRNNNLID